MEQRSGIQYHHNLRRKEGELEQKVTVRDLSMDAVRTILCSLGLLGAVLKIKKLQRD
jgi:hypothetical protein